MQIPDRVKQKLSMIVSLIVIIILLVSIWYIYPSLFQSVPPKRTEWAYSKIQIKELNNDGMFGEGVTVAIIDTGIDNNHTGLDDLDDDNTTNDPKVIAFYDAIDNPDNTDGTDEPYDPVGHGSHCYRQIASIACGIAHLNSPAFLGPT